VQELDPELVAHVDRIALALTIIAGVTVLLGTLLAVVLVANLFTLRALTKLMKRVDQQMERLAPRIEPLIERMTRLASDTQDITDHVRRGVRDVMHTVDDLNRSLRDAGQATERRVREFGAVIDIVKEEAEQVLIDSAATARGVSVAAGTLRGESRYRPRSDTSPPAARTPELPANATARQSGSSGPPAEPVAPVVSSASTGGSTPRP
jgi:uncharacterized protein YoxC